MLLRDIPLTVSLPRAGLRDDVHQWHDIARRLHPLRPAAPMPRPWLHLIRFHGALAPNAGLRAALVLAKRRAVSVAD